MALPVDLEPLRRLPYPVDPARPLISLDTETTGLGSRPGTVAFLIGVGRWDGADFVTSQLLMADHADEPALLEALDARIPADAWLVTYNGRSVRLAAPRDAISDVRAPAPRTPDTSTCCLSPAGLEAPPAGRAACQRRSRRGRRAPPRGPARGA